MNSSPSQARPFVSVIVPTLNEVDNIDALMEHERQQQRAAFGTVD